jgi:hypothetical protein
MSVISPPKQKVQQKARVPYRISVDQYQQMVQAGILGKYDRCVLIEGMLVEKMVRNPPHDDSLLKTDRRLTRLVPEQWLVRKQSALVLDDSLPEPDVVVARGDESTFASRHPGPADVGLLCEIADSSLRIDREMAGVYARNNIPSYWIVNLSDDIVEVYTQPSGPTQSPSYANRHDYAREDSVPLVLDGKVIAMIPVAELLS